MLVQLIYFTSFPLALPFAEMSRSLQLIRSWFHCDPQGTKFDKVEKYSWGDVGPVVGHIDLLYPAILFDEMLGFLQLVTA